MNGPLFLYRMRAEANKPLFSSEEVHSVRTGGHCGSLGRAKRGRAGSWRTRLWLICAWLGMALEGGDVLAAGSGLNTIVVVNQASADSIALGNYYCELREVPPENVLRIDWVGTNTVWTSNEFQATLAGPLWEALTARQLTNQIEYVVLSMDIPFQINTGSALNSTTAALFYGVKPDTSTTANSYAGSEGIFRQAGPATASGPSFLATMITGRSLELARKLVDQGVMAESQTVGGKVVLEKTSDPMRNIRYAGFDNVIFNTRLRGNNWLMRTNSDVAPAQTNLMGFQTGMANISLGQHQFRPGALADSMTSYGGVIFGPNSQTSLLAFTEAGAAGSYGTVAEPYATPQRFPDPQVFFLQSRGFSLAECYYQAVAEPFLGLVVGDGLSAPYRQSCSARWPGTNLAGILSGTVQTSVSFSGADHDDPFQQVDLFIDGKFARTLTNMMPAAGNVLTVTLNGFEVNYTVPSNSTLATAAQGLAAALNSSAVTNATQVLAFAHGDRIELHSLAGDQGAVPYYVVDGVQGPASGAAYRFRYLPDDFPPQITGYGMSVSGKFRLSLGLPAPLPYVLEASTDFRDWLPIWTNATAGLLEFSDPDSRKYSSRFYRLGGRVGDPRPALSIAPGPDNAGMLVRLQSWGTVPYAVQTSTNLADWVSVATNLTGGWYDYLDLDITNVSARAYRACLVPEALPAPGFSLLTVPAGTNLIRVTGAQRPYVVEESTNLTDWAPVITNFGIGKIQVSASSAAGAASGVMTHVTPARGSFLDSEALGIRDFTVERSPQVGTWLKLSVLKTNGVRVSVALTNQTSGVTISNFCRQLTDAVNSAPVLQGPDGVTAQDLTVDAFGVVHFNVAARSPGYLAGLLRLQLAGSFPLRAYPSLEVGVTNTFDLQPRNHLYVSSGLMNLPLDFSLDTTALSDGFHELTAVAYEGTHVRSQTRAAMTVQVRNTPLQATLTRLDLPDTAPAQGEYHISVAANTNSVSSIRLYSTGGELGAVTNQSQGTFTISGAFLGPGLHAFYALVTTTNGPQYHTEKQWVRLMP